MRARVTFSRMSLTFAVYVVANGHDELFEVAEDTAPHAAFGQIAEEALDHV